MEVVIDCVQSAVNAEKAGAIRVELCSNLVEGGTTPSLGVFEMIKEATNIPVFVMIRPRGGDFLYSDLEFAVMVKEIEIFKDKNADGFVFGLLKSDGTVDMERNQVLIDMCKPLPVTFHRAFDVVTDGFKALEDIISLGFDRILTSGMEPTALEGLPFLTKLIEKAGDRIIIMPGGGINEKNLSRILEHCKAKEFHGSARSSFPSNMTFHTPSIHMGAALYRSESTIRISSYDKLNTMLNIRRNLLG